MDTLLLMSLKRLLLNLIRNNVALLYTHLAAALIGAAVAATSAWQIQSWRFDSAEKTRL